MLFSSMIFLWIFLPCVLLLNFIAMKRFGVKGSNAVLFVSSLFFYAWGEPVYVLLMLFSIFVNWAMGCLLGRAKHSFPKKLLLTLSVVINLALLCYFKYLPLAADLMAKFSSHTIDATSIPMLPIGISFYTFQAMSYVIDVYRGDCKYQKNPFRVGLYVSFFPQLIAGPILKYKDVEKQIRRRRLTVTKTADGVRRFIYGLGKKVLIANVLAAAADKLYGMEIGQVTGGMAWAAAILYTLQIYYDFSGYSDMAIGLGKMFGFNFKENFIYPYTAHSIREFWKRWHISLGTWFREYVYIPLGGNRKGAWRTYRNLVIVFFLTGLWHGASVSFVLWGLYHGCFSILERVWLGKRLDKHRVIATVYCMLVVLVGWVFFRVENIADALIYLKHMFMPWAFTSTNAIVPEILTGHVLAMAAMGILGTGFIQRGLEGSGLAARWKGSFIESLFLVAVLWLAIMSLASNTYNPFIYFRF